MNTIISIILPTYNRRPIVLKAINSILSQSFHEFELIVIDDGSTDGTVELIKSIDDNRLKTIFCKANLGAAGARNTGLRASSGKYIAFQDSDVIWDSKKLEMQFNVLESDKSVGVVFTKIRKVKGNLYYDIPGAWDDDCSGEFIEEILISNFIDTPSVLIRKELIEEFDSNLKYLEDWDLFIRLAQKTKFYYIKEPLVISYFSIDGVNNQDSYVAAKTLNYIIDKYFVLFKQRPHLLSKYYHRIGYYYLELRKKEKAKEFALYSLTYNKFDIKAIVLLISSFLSERIIKKILKIREKSNSKKMQKKYVINKFE